jgi:hypothetical protein
LRPLQANSSLEAERSKAGTQEYLQTERKPCV